MSPPRLRPCFLGLFLICLLSATLARAQVEVATLTPETWDEFAPAGKEVDAIYGDVVLRNEYLVAVIAQAAPTRNANMTVRNVGGMLIDLTQRQAQADQLSAFYPGGARYTFGAPQPFQVRGQEVEGVTEGDAIRATGASINVTCVRLGSADEPRVAYSFRLFGNSRFLQVVTRYTNNGRRVLEIPLADAIRADRTFRFGHDERTRTHWAYDEAFGQAYGAVYEEGYTVEQGGSRNSVLTLHDEDGPVVLRLEPGESGTVTRRMYVAASLPQLLGIVGRDPHQVSVAVTDPAGPVDHARIVVNRSGEEYGTARTNDRGRAFFRLPADDARYSLTVTGLGRPPREVDVPLGASDSARTSVAVELEPCGYVRGNIRSENGGPIPCKISFNGVEGTDSPNFGVDSGHTAIQNVVYSHNGSFRQEIGPGTYDVVVSYGPEYDAVYERIEVTPSQETVVAGRLVRVVDTTGWISAEYHSHSSPSGDNTSSQLGRVQNLICEHLEFAPCTEHNRIDTYRPHLQALGVAHLMATCPGIELTGSPGSVNHQNAFPLVRRPRTQDGGAPVTDSDPVVQIERLAMWDDESHKLVQTNHPDLLQILGDRNTDGAADGGFAGMFAYMDVIEIHPPAAIFNPPSPNPAGRRENNRMFNWMQLLNLGYRHTGVVNTDAHYNFHGSGWLRNYIRSSTDNPAEIDVQEMVNRSEAGQIVMTTGPFMEVAAKAEGQDEVGPGDDLAAPTGQVTLSVRVQCANWLDVNRVQVFLNGRPEAELNWTRRTRPEQFSDDTVRFEAEIPLELKQDTHVIVATIGEGLKLGPVMGPQMGERAPVAVSNPIFVDVDGGGFQANGDRLAFPLPVADDFRGGSE